jgi:hypothetical protein
VALVSRTMGDSRRSSSVVMSTRIRSAKSRSTSRPGMIAIGVWVLAMMMRSNGSSKMNGAAIAPMAALASLIPPLSGLRAKMMKKTTTTAVNVTGAT